MLIHTKYADDDVTRAAFDVAKLDEADRTAAEILDEISEQLKPWAELIIERHHTEHAGCIARLAAEVLLTAHYHSMGVLLPESGRAA